MWISVDNNLPRMNDNLLVVDESGDMWIAQLYNMQFYRLYNNEKLNDITHWQLLPKPPIK